MELSAGDTVIMKKKHPCGSSEWKLLRVGMDIRLSCCGCGRQLLLPRRDAEKAIKTVKPKELNV